MPKVTPHVCRHTFCSKMAAARMNPKTLQYIMGHSDIGVTLNTYTHLGFDEASEEMRRVSGNWCKNRGCKRNRLAPRFTPFDGRNIGNNADLCKNNEKAQRPEKPLKAAVCGIIRRNERIKKTWLKSYLSATATYDLTAECVINKGNLTSYYLISTSFAPFCERGFDAVLF